MSAGGIPISSSDYLGKSSLVALALGLDGQTEERLPGRMHAELGSVGHTEAQDVHVLRGPAPTASVKNATPIPISSPRSPLFGLLAAKILVARHLHREPHRLLVLARVIDPPRLGRVGELLGLDEVTQTELDRVHARSKARQSTMRSTR